MKIYLAAFSSISMIYHTDYGAKRILVSFAEMLSRYRRTKTMRHYNSPPFDKLEIFLDSGAFTAFTIGEKINLWEYIDFIQKYGKRFSVIASLDVVGNPEKTYTNFKDMQRMGINAIPTFHAGEPWEVFDRYCKESDHVAVGGLVRGILDNGSSLALNRPLRMEIIQKVLDRLPKGVKIHLFGLSDVFLLKKFASRIHSIDTSSWLSAGKYALVHSRSGKTFGYSGTTEKSNSVSYVRRVSYACRRFLELEQDINNSLQKDLMKEQIVPIKVKG